ncbi:hypothetical protein M885DRAFT_536827 [Pelagophyceae sp. CCMP2097]|nr:hypothetical protein M885DRAFT_536827 [Pelagophyceae sp. CCMP2097]
MSDRLLHIGLRLCYTCTPVALYVPQFYHLKRSAKDGFASATCLVLLVSSVFRIVYWAGRDVRDASFLAYSIVTTVMQLLLLDAVVSTRRKKQAASARRVSGGASAAGAVSLDSSRALATTMRALAAAVLAGDAPAARDRWRTVASTFWNWDELGPYVEVVVVFALAVAAISVCSLRYAWYHRAIGWLGAVAEAAVGLPQIFENVRRGDASGLAPLMVCGWLGGDVLKYVYYTSVVSLQPFARLTLAQIAGDATLLLQILRYSATCKRCLSGGLFAAAAPEKADEPADDHAVKAAKAEAASTWAARAKRGAKSACKRLYARRVSETGLTPRKPSR